MQEKETNWSFFNPDQDETAAEKALADRLSVYTACKASCAIVAMDDDECTCGHAEAATAYRKARGL